jgi:hypothetical protein
VHRLIAATALAGAVVALPAPALAAKKPPKKDQSAVKVMTRNIYLGGDIVRPVIGAAGCSDAESCIRGVANATHTLRGIVDQTDFPARAVLLANEVAAHKPDVIGLQEVATWRSGPRTTPFTPDAQNVELDFLKILQENIEARGLKYRVAAIQAEADIEAPAFEGEDTEANDKGKDVRLTMHDVLLVRKAKGIKIHKKGSGQYEAGFDAPLGSYASVRVPRGYTWADVTVRKQRFRAVNTHLESFFSRIALAQAQELLAGPAKKGRMILLGDFNSDPLDASEKPGDIPHHSAYRFVTEKFKDAWLQLKTKDPGHTSGYGEMVNDPDTTNIDHRIDFVFSRGFKARKGWIVGTDPDNRTSSGLWPSDHAGVVATLGRKK